MGAIPILLASLLCSAGQALEADFDGRRGFAFGEILAAQAPPAPPARPRAKWTVLVYMNAKNDLESYGLRDLNEMETAGSSPEVNIVAELGRIKGYDASDGDWTGSRRYLVKKDHDPAAIKSPVLAESGKTDMGDWRRLAEFGRWAKENFPAERYLLIVWNHGSGWDKAAGQKGISYDEETRHMFSTPQLGAALAELGPVDVYASDACLMQMVEVAYELRDHAAYIAGSEELVPQDGYDYAGLLPPLLRKPAMGPQELGTLIVESYAAHYQGYGGEAAQSLLVSARFPAFRAALEEFLHALRAAGEKEAVREAVNFSPHYSVANNKDLYSFVALAAEKASDPAAKEKGARLLEALSGGLVAVRAGYPASRGAAVYLPQPANHYFDPSYLELKWARDSSWDEFINWYMN